MIQRLGADRSISIKGSRAEESMVEKWLLLIQRMNTNIWEQDNKWQEN